MFVFRGRLFEAFERVDDALAVAVGRLIEGTSFGAEPEYLADTYSLATLTRRFEQCPAVQGLSSTRRALLEAIEAEDQGVARAIRTNLAFDALIGQHVSAHLAQRSTELLDAIAQGNVRGTSVG